MKIDAALLTGPGETAIAAAEMEQIGHHGVWLGETGHDPFLMLQQAANATEAVSVGSAVAVAFARNPMTLASSAYDLAEISGGRFILGLGSQVRAHIERRFSMPWSRPAARMREMALALRAIWATWHDGEPLDFSGEFYTHTLMTPYFSPPAHEWGPPAIFIAGVGPRMTEVAGEVADGFLLHPFTTTRYFERVTTPALVRGRKVGGHSGLDDFQIAGPVFVCTGRDEEELAKAVAGTKEQIAFYASTPSYRGVLELHGWDDLQPELARLTHAGRWSDLGAVIDDEVLHAMAVVGEPGAVGEGLRERFGEHVTRVTPTAAVRPADSAWAEMIMAASV